MKLLLDTHIWLWSLLDPERLARPVADALQASATERWLSPLSVWEALMAIERGRLDVDGPPEVWLRQALARAPVTEAIVTTEVAFASRSLRMTHPDPVDRFLVATANVFELTLVTADEALIKAGCCRLLTNAPKRRAKPRS